MKKRVFSFITTIVIVMLFLSGCNFFSDPYGGMTTPRLIEEKLNKTDEYWARLELSGMGEWALIYLAVKGEKFFCDIVTESGSIQLYMDMSDKYAYVPDKRSRTLYPMEVLTDEDVMYLYNPVPQSDLKWTNGNEKISGYLYYYEETEIEDTTLRVYYDNSSSDKLRYLYVSNESGEGYIKVAEYGTEVDEETVEMPKGYKIIDAAN